MQGQRTAVNNVLQLILEPRALDNGPPSSRTTQGVVVWDGCIHRWMLDWTGPDWTAAVLLVVFLLCVSSSGTAYAAFPSGNLEQSFSISPSSLAPPLLSSLAPSELRLESLPAFSPSSPSLIQSQPPFSSPESARGRVSLPDPNTASLFSDPLAQRIEARSLQARSSSALLLRPPP
ncbi:hypothetical protein K456DRAFT_916511 [Colletotrichum gloeosporioides 23]|nr:hypothetical protein K456DRAFT_916511 [Colletotrichum gloeosporioides 23]